jgi:hypothetical protein
MKTAIVFLVAAALFFAAIYIYYLRIGGTPIEELVNQALGIKAEKEEGGGLPIVVSLGPYFTIIALLIAVGILLELRRKQKQRCGSNSKGG